MRGSIYTFDNYFTHGHLRRVLDNNSQLTALTLQLSRDLLSHRWFEKALEGLNNLASFRFEVFVPSDGSPARYKGIVRTADLLPIWKLVKHNGQRSLKHLSFDFYSSSTSRELRNERLNTEENHRLESYLLQDQPDLRRFFPAPDFWGEEALNLESLEMGFHTLDTVSLQFTNPSNLRKMSIIDCAEADRYLWILAPLLTGLKYLKVVRSVECDTIWRVVREQNFDGLEECHVVLKDTYKTFKPRFFNPHKKTLKVLYLDFGCIRYSKYRPGGDFEDFEVLEELAISRRGDSKEMVSRFLPWTTLMPSVYH